MAGFKFKNYKPFECDIIEIDSVLVSKVLINFGTVICTASNSLTNYFIPTIEGRELIRSDENGFLENNSLIINQSKGCICIKITLKEFDTSSVVSEWSGAFVSGTDAKFINYIKKYLLPSMINIRVSTSLNTYSYFGDGQIPKTGLQEKTLVTTDPTGVGEAKEREEVRKESERRIAAGIPGDRPNWQKENSAFYKLVNKNGKEGFDARPLDICFDHNLFPLINISNKIDTVSIEFIATTDTKEVEEKLDKYNFIEDNIKYIPIAWIDSNSNPILEQIVDFDYIYSFPYYFSLNNSKSFKTTT